MAIAPITPKHVAWIEFLKRYEPQGCYSRIPPLTELVRQGEQTMPNVCNCQQHQSRVEEHLKEVERHP